MTSKEKKLKAILELATVQARIDELERSKSYVSSSVYYRNRLTALQEKEEQLVNIIEGKEVEEVKLVFRVPESLLKVGVKEPEDFVQFFKREFLIEA